MNNWIIKYTGWKPDEHSLREAICTLGNGYFATRGAHEESGNNEYNYPGTYLAGGYNRLLSEIKNKKIENEDLVNWPNWLVLTFRHNDSAWFDMNNVEVLEYILSLNLREGLLERKMRMKDNKNRITTLLCKRMVCMHEPHLAGIEWTIIPENWKGEITVRSALDGKVKNQGVARYRELNSDHLRITGTGELNDSGMFLLCETNQSKISMAQVASTRFYKDNKSLQVPQKDFSSDDCAEKHYTVSCKKLEPLKVEKLVAIYTSRDFAISEPLNSAIKEISRIERFNELEKRHSLMWEQKWKNNHIEIETENNDILFVRMHMFHLYQTVSHNSIGTGYWSTVKRLARRSIPGPYFLG